ncbi:hypothetical protein HMPREF9989_03419 [Staphylococcus epidermidis NIHLM057]|nr:hypothetical protein HMPREF9989_03419 [Staphylococcus epidermidis NIHLM057]
MIRDQSIEWNAGEGFSCIRTTNDQRSKYRSGTQEKDSPA